MTLESLFGLAGRTALVTGGSRGIGRAACLGLAQAGAAVAVHYGSDAAAAAEVVAEIEAAGGRAVAFGADLSRPELIAPLLAEVGEFAGESGLGVLVNNAGIYPPGSIESLTAEEWDRVFARQRARAVPGHAGGAAAAAPGRRRARDQRRHGDVPPRRARLAALRRVEGRRARPDALPGARARARRHHRQLPRAQHGRTRIRPTSLGIEVAAIVAEQVVPEYQKPDDLVGAILWLASPREPLHHRPNRHGRGG